MFSTPRPALQWALVWMAVGCGSTASETRLAQPPPSITMLDRGSEPRHQFRFEFAANTSDRSVMEAKARTKTAYTNTVLETGHRDFDFPTVKFMTRVTVAAVSPTGEASLRSTIEDVDVLDDVVDPRIGKVIKRGVRSMKGMNSSWTVAPNGIVSNLLFDAPNVSTAAKTAMTRYGDSIHTSGVVFPDEAIGVGAAWQVVSQQKLSGIIWTRTVTYRLKSFTDSSATIESIVVMNAGEQAISVEPNATTKVTSAHANATGEFVVPLHKLVVIGTEQTNSEVNFQIVRGRLRITSTVTTEGLTTVRPADATPSTEPAVAVPPSPEQHE